MSKPKILFGMNSTFAVQNLLPDILSMAQQKGFETVVVAPHSPGSGAPTLPGKTILRPISMSREIALFSDLRALWQLWCILRSVRPSITDMSTPKMGFLGGLAAWLAGVPHRMYTLRGLRYETTRSWKRHLLIACERIACGCAHQVICISRSVRDNIVRDGIVPPEKTTLLGDRGSEGIVIPPIEANAEASRRQLREAVGIPKGAPVIGFVGRLTRDKGVDELVLCFRTLRREGHDIHLLLLGNLEAGDPVDPDTAAWIRNDPNVHWVGFVPNPEAYYPLMDLFVFPTYREGLPKVLLEAAAAAVPIVSTFTTGVVDIIQSGVTGILVPPRNEEALRQATRLLLQDSVRADRMARAARAMVLEHFDNSVYLERLGAMLLSLANYPEPRIPGSCPVAIQTE